MYSRPLRPNELYHHGILGMHWGIRRYQPYPKGYNGKGKEIGDAAKKPQDKTTNQSPTKPKSKSEQKISERVSKAVENCKKSYISTQAAEYRKKYKGMSVAESRKLSEKKLNMMKKVAIASAVVGGTVAAVALSRYIGRNYINGVIKAGTTLQTLSWDQDRLNKGTSFFTTFKDKDKNIYEIFFGGASNKTNNIGKYKLQADVTEDVKIAGRKAAQKVYKNLVKTDLEFANLARDIESSTQAIKRIGSSSKRLAYDRFNFLSLGLGDSEPTSKRANEIFFKALKEKGFGAVLDVNDTRYSNLRGDSPVVFFDKDKIANIRDGGQIRFLDRFKSDPKTGLTVATMAKKDRNMHELLDSISQNGLVSTIGVSYFTLLFGTDITSAAFDTKVAIDQKTKKK